MADNVLASVAVGTGATFATKDILGIQYPRNILVTAAGVDISPLAEGGNVAVSNFPASQAVTGTFWQATQPVSIAGTVAVSGPLTDAQLRLSAVPVTMASTTVTGSVAVTGTFWQATQPISGTVTVNTISGFATETTAAAINATLTAGTVQLAAGGAIGVTPSTRAVQVSGSDYGGTPLSRAIKVDAAGAQYIGNFPATQAVTGTFWQTTQPVSLTSTTITGTVAVTAPTITKGTQGANGFTTQDLHNAGRAFVNAATAIAGVTAVTAEALLTLNVSRDAAAVAAVTTIAVTSGKRLRIIGISCGMISTGAAVLSARVSLRVNPSGVAAATSPILCILPMPSGAALAQAGGSAQIMFPEAIELSGTMQCGLSQVASAITGTIWASLIAYEY